MQAFQKSPPAAAPMFAAGSAGVGTVAASHQWRSARRLRRALDDAARLRCESVIASPERKKGCNHGACRCLHGAGRWSPGAFLPDTHARVRDREITTIEGLAGCERRASSNAERIRRRGRAPVRLLHAWPDRSPPSVCWPEVDRRAPARRPLRHAVFGGRADLDEREIRERMSGNLCRCAAYQNIVAAIRHVAASTAPNRD